MIEKLSFYDDNGNEHIIPVDDLNNPEWPHTISESCVCNPTRLDKWQSPDTKINIYMHTDKGVEEWMTQAVIQMTEPI